MFDTTLSGLHAWVQWMEMSEWEQLIESLESLSGKHDGLNRNQDQEFWLCNS